MYYYFSLYPSIPHPSLCVSFLFLSFSLLHTPLSLTGLRRAIIPVFFDMMEYQWKFQKNFSLVSSFPFPSLALSPLPLLSFSPSSFSPLPLSSISLPSLSSLSPLLPFSLPPFYSISCFFMFDQFYVIVYNYICQMEREMIDKLDLYVSEGMGDQNYRDMLQKM